MTQDELRLEEASQSIRISAQQHLVTWADEALKEVLDAHRSRLQRPEQQAERQALLQKGLEEAIHHRTTRHILQHAIDELKATALFSKDQLLSIQRNVSLALERLPIHVPVQVPQGLSILDPLRVGGCIAMAGFFGVFVGNQLQHQGSLPLLGGLFLATCGGIALAWLQKRQLLQPHSGGLWGKLYKLLSVDTTAGEDWLVGPRSLVEQALHHLSAEIALLVQYAALLTLQRQEDRQEESDLLQHLFHKCTDGFAEVYYGEVKRDPERALDACIKLVGDLQDAGVEITTLERGTAYVPTLEAHFVASGRIEEGDPVMMIHPAWQWRGRTLAKGTIKRTKR